MANLQGGTRIYGTANVDTQINVATGNAVINATGFFVNTYPMASNSYVQTIVTTGGVSNTYATNTYISNNYYSTLSTGISNSYATAAYVSNSYFRAYPDTMTVAMSNETSNLVASSTIPNAVIRLPFAATLISPYIRIAVTTAPTGSSVTADVRLVGTGTIISGGAISIAATSNTSAASIPTMTTTALPDDSQLQFFTTAIGSTIAGAGLKATIYFIRQT